MDAQKRRQWLFEAMSFILRALAANESLRNNLVFKGAFILGQYLVTARRSLDLDSNLASDLSPEYSSREKITAFLSENVTIAIKRHIKAQNPQRYALESIQAGSKQKTSHRRGWDGFHIKIRLSDNQFRGVSGLPSISIDVAAPESLSSFSVKDIEIGDHKIRAYSLERIAGEKARAYLSSLPTYRRKIESDERTARVRDLYDLSRIFKEKPISETKFWKVAGDEFRLACKSRLVDCQGMKSFKEGWLSARVSFDSDPRLPKDIKFAEVEESLSEIVAYWEGMDILPFTFPIE